MAGCGVNKNHRPHHKFRPRPACGTREATGNMQIQPHQHQQVQPQRKRRLWTDAIQTSVRRVCGDDTRNALLGAHREVQRSSSGVSTAIRSRLGVTISLHTFYKTESPWFCPPRGKRSAGGQRREKGLQGSHGGELSSRSDDATRVPARKTI